MIAILVLTWLIIATCASFLTSTITYALRDFSKTRLAEALGKRNRDKWYEPTIEHVDELAFALGTIRLLANLMVMLAFIEVLRGSQYATWVQDILALLASVVLLAVFSLALPHALARQNGEMWIARFVRPSHCVRRIFAPARRVLWFSNSFARRTGNENDEAREQRAEAEIYEAIEEGATRGIVDQADRQLMERVMDFSTAIVDEAMTPRKRIVGAPSTATLDQLRSLIERSGHSRLPIYEGSLDKVIGVVYARDILKHWGQLNERIDINMMLRQPLFVPRTRLLRDLLDDFRARKVHIAIALDEYQQTAGIITIEDILEQLVGDISDEHEPLTTAMFQRIDEKTVNIDARLEIVEFNRATGLHLPEEEDFETVGGYVSTTLGRIPQANETFESAGAKFTVLEAEPKRVVRLRVELPEIES
ncbi:MAG TPA: hemolysin family protein [Tepidisphaeraceae bacterium]|nr:hemolysin family protein [Tepidisphaeraceae bacterium]